MKLLLFNEVYNAYVNSDNPCLECILRENGRCLKVTAAFCAEYGGFQTSDTKIFTL